MLERQNCGALTFKSQIVELNHIRTKSRERHQYTWDTSTKDCQSFYYSIQQRGFTAIYFFFFEGLFGREHF